MPSGYTRHGTSRAGDDYQDLWGAAILVEFLEHPERYQWVRFEADKAGYLDDILALRTDGRYVARQVKFTVDAEDPSYEVNWHYLLEQKPGERRNRPSLLQKWATSLAALKERGQVCEAALYTNRQPAPEIQALLAPTGDGRLDFDAIANPEVHREICEQLGGVDKAKEFFLEFRFHLDLPEPHTLEDGLKRRLFQLGGDDHGWLNLLSEIRTWVKFKERPAPDGRITIQTLRHAVRWYQLHELPQGFEVPPDYVLSSEEFHRQVIEAIRSRTRPCLALWGSPGAGKSTYLSYLVTVLRNEGIPVVRHHYFLSLTDRSGDRFSRRVVAESLMQQISARYPKALGPLAVRNPDPKDLQKWLESCGRHFATQSQPFVVIVDGLDHVWRERRSMAELTLLFEDLLPPPDGVVVIVGTQKIAPEQLPQRLLMYAPQGEWWQLPSLSVVAIKKWLEFRAEVMVLPSVPQVRKDRLAGFAQAFFQISQGHPLHLRYSFEALIRQGWQIREQTILSLPPCPEGDIEKYYERLWDSLQDEGKHMLHLLAGCDFPWPKEGLVTCLSAGPAHDATVMRAKSQIVHLLRWNELGATAFHNSLLVFVRRRPDHQLFAERLRPKVLDWLVNRAPDYWRWAYEWIVRAEVGDPAALREGPNQSWVIEALAVGRPPERITDILQRAAWLALDSGDLARVIALNTLWQYVENAAQFETETFERLRFCQLRLNEGQSLYRRMLAEFRSVSDGELVVIAEVARLSGMTQLPQDCFNEFDRRVRENYEVGGRRDRSPESDVERYVELAALVEHVNQDRLLRFIRRNRRHKREKYAFSIYCRHLLALGKVDALRTLFRHDLDDNDTYDLVTAGVRLACEEGIDLNLWTKNSKAQRESLLLCYQLIRGETPPSHFFIETPDMSHLQQKEYELIGRRWDLVRFFHRVFFSSLALALCSEGSYSDVWQQGIRQNTWVEGFCCHLAELARECGKRLRSGERISYSWVYQAIQVYPPPSGWGEDRSTRGFKVYATHALIEIALDLHLLSRLKGGPGRLAVSDIQEVVGSSYWNREVWLDRYIENRRQLLTDEAVKWLFKQEEDHLSQTINQLNERAVAYTRLAQIALLHGEKFGERAKGFLRKSASCLIGYGSHKDYLLFYTLEIVEACHQANIRQARSWLLQLAPMISAVTDFTDGDETSDLAVRLAGVVLTVCPELFLPYYQHLVTREEWDDAERAFHIFLRRANLDDPVVQAIARTVVDAGGLSELESRADAGDLGARAAFETQMRFLGGVPTAREDTSSGNSTFEPREGSLEQQERPQPPASEEYPPEQLQHYADRLRETGLGYHSELVTQWFDYWCKRGQQEQVLDALSSLASVDRYKRMIDHLSDRIFELCLAVRGRLAAYPWIVEAHRARHGWSTMLAGRQKPIKRLTRVAELYADRWWDFICDVAEPEYGVDRIEHIPVVGFELLVKFCLMVGQREVAAKMAEIAVQVTLERKADLALPIPKWVPVNEIE